MPVGDDSGKGPVSSSLGIAEAPLEYNPDSLSLDPIAAQSDQTQAELPKRRNPFSVLTKKADLILAILLVVVLAGLLINTTTDKPEANQVVINDAAARYETQDVPLGGFVVSQQGVDFGVSMVAINGELTINGEVVITPTLQPSAPKAGQLYYDRVSNLMAYYNGTEFVTLGTDDQQVVESLGGLSGQVGLAGGLAVVGNQLVNSGVLSLGGSAGAIVLGNGLNMTSNVLQNTGVLNITAGTPNVTITNNGGGNISVSVAGAGTGTVSSSGGTNGAIPVFTTSQNIEDSILSQSGGSITVGGNLSVTGSLSLGSALTVANGGTGATSLAANGVIVGNGAGALSSVVAGGAGLCFVSTAGAPTWGACSGGGSVTSLNGLTGALTIANASAAGSTVTIDDATTVSKGIASFNNTNFTVISGAVNTIQNINSGATPTFAGVNTNSVTPSAALTVGVSAQTALLQGSTTTITSNGAGNDIVLNSADTIELQDNTNVTGNVVASGDIAVNGGDFTSVGALNITPGGTLTAGVSTQTLTLQGNASTSLRSTNGANTTIVGFVSPTANTTLNFPALSAGTYTICTTSGNCAGAGVTLQGAYDNSASPEIVLDATRGALTIRDNLTPLGANLLEVQNNGGGTTYLAVTASGIVVTGTASVTGNINSSGGALQTGGTTRVDNSGNLTNIGSLSLSGAISGGTTITGSGNINSTGGAIQTNGTTRIDNTGNLTNIASITASGNAVIQGGAITLGTNAQAGTVVLNDGSSNTGTLAVAALGQNTVFTLPDPGAGTATICISTGNCAGAAGGVTTLGGTTNTLAKFTGSQTIGDSIITDNGSTVTIGGTLSVNTITPTGAFTIGATGQTTTLQGSITTITSSGAGNDIVLNSADTIELQDSTNIAGNLDVSGTLTSGTGNAFQVDASGNVTGGTFNGQTISSTASFTGTVTVATGLTLTSGNLALSSGDITASGNATLQGGTVTVGTTSQAGALVLNDGSSNTGTLAVAALGQNTVYTLPDPGAGTATICLSTGNCAGAAATLQSAYDNSTSPEIVLDATRAAVTIRDNSTPLGTNLLEVQNNGGGTTYFAVTASGVSVTGTATATGNINSSGGALQTGGTTRVDNSGNLTNIGSLSLSGAISGGTTYSGSGNINTSGGELQTAGTARVDNSGNLVNIGNLTATGNITVASSGAGNDVIIDGADQFIIQDAAVVNGSSAFNGLATFNTDVDLTLAETENLSITSTVTGTNSVDVIGAVLTNNSSSGTQQVALLQNASGSGATEGLLVLDNADIDTAVTSGLQITSAAGGITTAIDVSDPDIATALLFGLNDITGTNFSVTGSNGNFTTAGNATVQGGTVSVGTTSQAGTLVVSDGSSHTGTIQTAALGQNTVYALPDPGAGTATICLSTGNCAGAGTSVTTSGGTANRLAKFSASQNIENSTITDDGTTVTTTVDLVVQGGDLTVGTSSQLASLLLHDGNGQTTTFQAGDSAGNLTFIFPTNTGSANQCLKQSGTGNQLVWDACDGGGGGTSTTLQSAYDDGNTINTTTARDIAFTLADTATDSNFTITVADGATGTVSISRADGAGTSDPAQLLLIDNLDANRAVAAGVKLQAAAGGLTTAIDASDAEIVDAINVGANNIVGTTGDLNFSNFDVIGATGAVTGGTYNGQTISSTASFTGTVTIATDLTLTAGDLAVNGGNITSSGALSIDPGGAFTAGATGQTTTLRGSTTSITSNGAGNDITLTSADQILLNAGSSIELQDNTNITGNLDVSGTLTSGTGNAFQVDASGNVLTTGTYNTNTFDGDSLTFGAAATAVIQSATSQALTITGNAASTWSTSAGDLTVQAASNLNLRAAGGNVVVGTSDTTGTLLVVDVKTDAGDPAGTDGAIYYNSNLASFRCYQAGAWANCITASGGFVSLQNAYDNGNTISTDATGDIAFTLNNQNFTVATAAGATGSTTYSLTDGSNATPPAQLVLITNNDTDQVLASGVKVTSAAGGITTALDLSDAEIVNALSIGSNEIIGTSFSVNGSGAVTAGTYNGQTISAAASFTGTVTVATDLTLTAGDLAVNGGNITSSGALSIDPGGAFTAGATGQTTLLRGSTTSITSNGAGNDITLTSADQIILNAGSSVELQDNTNITGNLDVSGTLTSGTGNAFQVDASGNITGGTYNTNTFTGSALTFGSAATATIQSAASQALTITGNAASTWSTSAGDLTVQAASALNLRAASGNIVLGTSDTTGTLLVVDIKTDAGDPAGTDGAIYYNSNAGTFRCYQAGAWANCITASGGFVSLQNAYDNGNTISTDASGDIAFTLNNQNFTVATAAGATGSTTFSLTDGSNASPAAQLILITNNDVNEAIANGLTISSAAGGITDGLDVSDSDLVNAINIGANDILSNGVSISSAELNLLDGHDVALVDTNDAVNTAITGTGALSAGSITSSFGSIDVGTDSIQGGTATLTGANALTLGTTGTNTGAILFKGSTAASGTITLSLATNNPANHTISLPNETGTVCTTGSVCSGYQAAGSYANTALSNLASVAINTSLLSGSSTIDLGSGTNPFRDLYLGGTATNNFRFTGTASTARTLTLDDLSGRLALIQTAGSSTAQTGDLNVSGTLIAGTALQGTLVKSADGAGASSGITFRSGNTTGGTGLSTGAVTIQSGDGSGTNTSSGNLTIDAGSATGSGTAGTIGIGTANASGLTLGRSGLTTQNAGALTVSELLTASAGAVIAGNQNFTMNSGNGVFAQTFTNNAASSAQTLSVTNTNAGGTSVAVNGQSITLVGTATSGGININSAFNFADPTAQANNNFYGLNFAGTGYTDILRVNGTQIISGAGKIQNAAIDSTVSYSNLTQVGTLTSGALGAGFTTVAVAQGGTGATSFTSNGVLYGNNTGAIQATAAGTTGQCLVGNTGSAPTWSSCNGLVTLQNAYDAGNTISTDASGDIAFTLNGQDFTVTTAANTDSFTNFSLADGSNATPPAQLVLINNADTNEVLASGLKVTSAAGSITDGLDVSDADIVNAINIGVNDILSNGVSISSAELNLLDGHDVALVDTNDAVNTAITGTGALDSGSITANFGAINVGADNITTTGTVFGNDFDRTAAGVLTFGNTNATSISLCNSAACDTISIGTNADADSITIGDSLDTLALDAAATFGSTAGFNGLVTFNTDVDFVLAGTENINVSNTTGSNAVDLLTLTLTNNDAGAATQRGIVITNADSTSTTESLILLDNADTTASSLTDGILITSTGVNDGIVDAIDVSAANITNAINIGANNILSNGVTISSAELNLLDGHDVALVDTNDAVNTAITGTGTLTTGALGAGFATVAVGQGGTGATTFTANGVLYGNTTGAIQATAAGTTGQCLVGNTGSAPTWSGCSGLTTLQNAYDNGNTISTDASGDIAFTLNGQDFTVTSAAGTDSFTTFSLADGSNATPAAQLVLVQNLDTTEVLANGIVIQSAAGAITDGLDVSDAELVNAINIGVNDILSNGVSISSAELNLLDGHDVALVDTNDAVSTAIIGTGALDSGSITANFGAINVGTDNITTTGAVFGNDFDRTAAGALSFGNTNATSVSFCDSAACDTITIGTNADADTVTIGDINDTVDINAGSGGINLNSETGGIIVTDTSGSGPLLQLLETSTNQGAILEFAADAGADGQNYGQIKFTQPGGINVANIRAERQGGSTSAELVFETSPGAFGVEEALRIDLNGNIIAAKGVIQTSNLGLNFIESDTNPGCAAGEYRIYADLSETKLKKCENGSVTDLDTVGSVTWDAIGDPIGNGAINFGTTEQTMDWEFTTTDHDGITFNFDNNGGTAGNDYGLVINNAVSTNSTGDLTTEALLLVQQLDDTTSGTTAVTDGIRVDSAGTSGMTNGITITNTGGELSTFLRIAETTGGSFTSYGIDISGTFLSAAIDLTGAGTPVDIYLRGGLSFRQPDGELNFDEAGKTLTFDFDDFAGIKFKSTVALEMESSADGATAVILDATAGGVSITASGASAGEDIALTATGSSVRLTSNEAASDAIAFVLGNSASSVFIDAGTTDRGAADADALKIDVDVSVQPVDGISVDLDVTSALLGTNVANGINIDVNGNASDSGTAAVNGAFITGTTTSGAPVTGIKFGGSFDTGIDLSGALTTTDLILDDGLTIAQTSDNDLDIVENGLTFNADFGETTASTITFSSASDIAFELAAGTTDFIISGLDADSNIIFSGMGTDANAVLYTTTGGVVTRVVETETGSQCLLSGAGASGVPTWGSCSAGTTPDFDEVYAQSITNGNLNMEIDNAGGLTFDMTTTGNFAIRDGTTAIATFSNAGEIALAPTAAEDVIITLSSGDSRFLVNTTSYLTGVGTVDIVKSGSFTGAAGESGNELRIAPSATLTEPGSGTFTYNGQTINMNGLAVTAGAGTSEINALTIVGVSDADVGTSRGIFIEDITATSATEYGIEIGANWDRGINSASGIWVVIPAASSGNGATGLSVTAGSSGAGTFQGGGNVLTGGTGGTGSGGNGGQGGSNSFTSGDGGTTAVASAIGGQGGLANLRAGNGGSSTGTTGDGGLGGQAQVVGGNGGTGTDAGGDGGIVVIQAGNGANGTNTDGNGGNVYLVAGTCGTGCTGAAQGQVIVSNVADGALAFNVQNAALTETMFSVDTTSTNAVKIGNSTGTGAATTVFVLDNAAGVDPSTGVGGAMYYDSTNNLFKCYTTSWGNCAGAGGSPTLDAILAATGAGSAQDSNANTVQWNWDFTSAGIDSGLIISESSASTSGIQDQQALLELVTLSGSTASPLQVTAAGTDAADVWFNLSSSADFEIRDNGTKAFSVQDDGLTVVGNTTGSGYKLTVSAIGTTGLGGISVTAAAGSGGTGGGSNTFATGLGGSSSSGNGGIGGATTFTTGNGGQYAGSSFFAGGAGGLFSVTTGNGGTNSSTDGLSFGGDGGLISLTAGTGGTSNNINTTGGVGGNIEFTAGNGGASTSGGGGTGGSVTITAGTGADGGQSDGNAGNIRLQPGLNAVGSGLGGQVRIGAFSSDDDANLFVVDNYNNATDPTGTNGAIYYNSNAGVNKFRCYQNGGWTDCIGTGGGGGAFTSSSGVITKNTAGDRLSLVYGDAGDVQLDITNIAAATAPTADAFQILLSGGSGVVTDNVDGLYVNIEGADGTSTDVSGIHIDFDPIAGSADDTFSGLLIDAITGTSATEYGINIGSGWDSAIYAAGTVTVSPVGASSGAGVNGLVVVAGTGASGTNGNAGGINSIVSGTGGSGSSGNGGAGGALTLAAGEGGTSTGTAGGVGGAVTLSAGNGGTVAFVSGGNGGAVSITSGTGSGSGLSSTGGHGGALSITSGSGGSGTTDGDGGDITIQAGAGATNGSGGDGGDITLKAGTAGSGIAGTITMEAGTSSSAFRVMAGGVGDIFLTVNGSSNRVQLGNSSGTTTVLALDNASSNPTVVAGGMFYHTTNGFMCSNGSAWASCGGGGTTPDFDEVYAQAITNTNLNMEIDNSGGLTFDLTTTGDFAIRDGTTAYATFDDSGGITFAPNGTSDFTFTGDSDSSFIVSAGNIVTSNEGIEFTESDTNPSCASGDYRIYADTSEGKLKKCQNGTVSDLDTDTTGGSPDTATFTDNTSLPTPADNTTTEYWNDTTRPNVTPVATSQTVLVTVSIKSTGGATADSTLAARIYRNIGSDPTCSSSTLVGETFSTFFTNSGEVHNATATFLDSPASTSNVRYTVCSHTDQDNTGMTLNDVTVTLVVLGADYAENYYTTDDSIIPGELVSIDSSLPAGAKKSTGAYDKNILGIVSTQPGKVLDDKIGAAYGRAIPVALSGRVPVKVSTENGQIKVGDLLTASSTPGVAMKATKAGQIVGQAMTAYAGDGVGTVFAFVKTDYANGTSVNDLIEGLGLSQEEATSSDLLQKLAGMTVASSSAVDLSDVVADRVVAGVELVTPKITADEVSLNTIKAATGDKIQLEGNLGVNGGLTVGGEAEFHGNSFFYRLVTFVEKTVFKNDITLAGHVGTVGTALSVQLEAAAGLAQAPADNPGAVLAAATVDGNDVSGQFSLDIGDNPGAGAVLTLKFKKPYDKAPNVLLTPANDKAGQVQYYVQSTTDGFKLFIISAQTPGTNLQFNYWATESAVSAGN